MAKYLDLTGLKYFITKRIGKTDISKIGDGTCTGAISALNQSLGNLKTDLNKLNSLGNISIMKMSTKYLKFYREITHVYYCQKMMLFLN